jgi:hypothetical protein
MPVTNTKVLFLVNGEAFGLRQCDKSWADNASAIGNSC